MCLRRLRDAPAGYGGDVTDAISPVPGADRWSKVTDAVEEVIPGDSDRDGH